ncbi:TraB/VirB10 family protein [Aquabacterium sp. NJ1]|uniref:TraB/VirB10 family protein n=1 Tax=Aquabacterium sp. NJ1 TaxID=1538295 RepID=UPI00068F0ABA|nr:TraB/VirB10 family protein [Aquabacterium sp. NJ1]
MAKFAIPVYSTLPTRTKQKVNMAMGGFAVLGLLITAMAMVGGTEPERKVVVPEEKKLTELPGDAVTDQELWMGGSGRKVNALEKRMDEYATAQKDSADALEHKLELMFKERFGDAANPKTVPGGEQGKETPAAAKDKAEEEGPLNVRPVVAEGATKTAPGLKGQPKSDIPAPGSLKGYPNGAPNDGSTASGDDGRQETVKEVREPSIIRVSVTSKEAIAQGGTSGKQEKATGSTYLPVGHVRAVLLGGLDAPTGGQSNSPSASVPTLLEIVDFAELPNGFRQNVKRCFVVAGGWGDVSSERAYLRTSSINCINRFGQAIEAPLYGHVFGDDGKNGVRGRLVSKQGQLLANALLSGVASGIGQAFAQQSVTVSTSPLGSTATPGTTPKDVMNSALGMGAGRAMDRLANYYITLAEKTFPVIEIDAGRFVDIAIMQGTNLEATLDLGNGDPSVSQSIGRYVARDARKAYVDLQANGAE